MTAAANNYYIAAVGNKKTALLRLVNWKTKLEEKQTDKQLNAIQRHFYVR